MDIKRDDSWADLHPNLLDQVANCVDSYGDYVRLRSTCKAWSLELPMNPKHIKNPWLVLPFDHENETHRPFFNVGENKVHYLDLPETQKTRFYGSYYDWLITIGVDGEVQMLNPFTRVQLDLPPLRTFPNVKSFDPERGGAEYTLVDEVEEYTLDKHRVQRILVDKLVISSLPKHNEQDFMAIAIYSEHGRLAYCRTGDSGWTDMLTTEIHCDYEDAIFHEGTIYVVDYRGQLYEFDMVTGLGSINEASPPPNINITASGTNHKYLVGTPDGLLMMIRHLRWTKTPLFSYYRTSGFEIYKLNRNKWLRVNSLGNYVMLLGYNSSICTSPATFPDGKGNRIYFTDNKSEFHNLPGQVVMILVYLTWKMKELAIYFRILFYLDLPRFGYSVEFLNFDLCYVYANLR